MHGAGQCDGITFAIDVHVEGAGARTEQMVVQRRDVDVLLFQLFHHGTDFIFGQHEVAHDHRLVPHGCEGNPRTQRQCRLEHDAVERDVQIGAWQSNTVDAAGHLGPRMTERCCHTLPVGRGLGRGPWKSQNQSYKGKFPGHIVLLVFPSITLSR